MPIPGARYREVDREMNRVGSSDRINSLNQLEILFPDLLEWAQNALSGRGELGILGRIADLWDRRRFASALWIESADGASFEFWLRNFYSMLLDNAIDPACVEIHDSSICPCGHTLAQHSEDDYMAPSGVSRAWHLYTSSHGLDSDIRAYRVQAVAEHPLLLDCVIEAAYGWRGPASRRAAAWRVLQAIDWREPLIDALGQFFRVGPAAIRALRQWRPSLRPHWITYPTVRRAANMLVGLHHETGMELDARAFWRWLPVAHVITRCTGVRVEYVMRSECLDGIDRLLCDKPVQRQKLLRKLRQAIRWLRCERGCHGGLPRLDRLFMAIGVPPSPEFNLDYCFALPGGWMAARLDCAEAIRAEGRVMRHCIRRYTNEVEQGEAQAYSLRSKEGHERATLVTRPCIGMEYNDEVDVTVAGKENDSMSLDALEAMVALLRIVSPKGARMRI